jgi:hypothetical protein
MELILGICLGVAATLLIVVMAFRSFLRIFGNPTGESPTETDAQDIERID